MTPAIDDIWQRMKKARASIMLEFFYDSATNSYRNGFKRISELLKTRRVAMANTTCRDDQFNVSRWTTRRVVLTNLTR